MTTLLEQETTLTTTRGDSVVYIYTASTVDIRKILSDDRFIVTSRSSDPENDWLNAQIDTDQIKPLTLKRRMSDKAKAEAAARFKSKAANDA